MRLRRNSARTQGGRHLKNIKVDFKFKLTRKPKHNKILNTQLSKTGNSPEKKTNISIIPVNLDRSISAPSLSNSLLLLVRIFLPG